jgi:hypothetical protein
MITQEVRQAYDELRLRHGAKLAEIKEAWRALSKQWHPDMYIPGSVEYRIAQENQTRINGAYDLLKTHIAEHGESQGQAPPPSPQATNGMDAGAMDAQYDQARAAEDANALQAMSVYKTLAQMGHGKSQFRLGYLYFDSIMKDLKLAAYCRERAASQGHAVAQYNLGLMYERGYCKELDHIKALYWFTEAAKRGDKQAQARVRLRSAVRSTAAPVGAATPSPSEPVPFAAAAAQPSSQPMPAGRMSEQSCRSFFSRKSKAS